MNVDIEAIFLKPQKKAWTSDLEWCYYAPNPAEGSLVFNI